MHKTPPAHKPVMPGISKAALRTMCAPAKNQPDQARTSGNVDPIAPPPFQKRTGGWRRLETHPKLRPASWPLAHSPKCSTAAGTPKGLWPRHKVIQTSPSYLKGYAIPRSSEQEIPQPPATIFTISNLSSARIVLCE